MKKICFLSAFSFMIAMSASAQLAKTKWSGTMKIPQSESSVTSMPVTWSFGKDTLSVEVGGGEPELFTFRDVKKVLTITKVSGSSPCPEGAKVTILYTIKGGELVFTNQTTDCDSYKKSTQESPFKKEK